MSEIKADFSNKIILIVEDCESCFLLLQEILGETGIKILHADNGCQALMYCMENRNINMVLMDIKIPEINGLEATRRIKAIRKDLPVIAQSASVFHEDKLKCKLAGCDGFIEKPINADKLIKMLIKWL